MTQYQPLEEEHLNITTVAVNPAQRGTWHASLAWFWSIDVQGDIEADDAMAECMYISLVKFYFTNLQHVIVYQVHWLKAKAQQDCWKEEVKVLYHEMNFCVNFMKHMEGHWNAWTSEGEGDSLTNIGLYCYALRQADMWRCMASQAWHKFDKVRQKIEHNVHK